MPETKEHEYQLESEFTYYKRKLKIVEESKIALSQIETFLGKIEDPAELRKNALGYAKSAVDQVCQNYDLVILASHYERRYEAVLSASAVFVLVAILSNFITAGIVWLFLR